VGAAAEGDPAAEAAAFVIAEKEVPDVERGARRRARHLRRAHRRAGEVRRVRARAFVDDGCAQGLQEQEHDEDKPTKFDNYATSKRGADDPVAPLPRDPPRRGRGRAARRIESTCEALREIARDLVKLRRARPGPPSSRRPSPTLPSACSPERSSDVRVELKMRRRPRRGRGLRRRTCASSCSPRRFGTKPVLGIDPGQRTGCKCAVVDATGKLLEHTTIYLVQGDGALEKSRGELASS
jgi:protein Tex